jgi:hypothetical protein
MAFEFKNSKGTTYYLHQKDVVLRGSKKKQRIYYFAREERKEAIDALPEGFKVLEVKKTGLPVLKKK